MGWAKIVVAACWVLLAASLAGPASAQAFPERGRNAVVDAAGVIPDDEEDALARRLTRWERATGHQLVVATVPDLEGRSIRIYARGLFNHWRLGRARENDGLLLLLAPNQRQVRIEVGSGLEASVTDAVAAEIIRETIIPDLDADPGRALGDGAQRLMQVVDGATAGTPARLAADAAMNKATEDGPSVFWVLMMAFTPAILIVVFLVWLMRRGRKPLPTGPVRELSLRAQRRRENKANARANAIAAGTLDPQFHYQHLSNDSSWSDSGGGGFESGGGSSDGGGSNSSY